MVDTHTHIYTDAFDEDRDLIIQRAVQAGVKKLCLPNIDVHSIEPLNSLCDQYPQLCFPMMGLHPTDVRANYQSDLDTIYRQFQQRTYIAVGEIGIDLYWDKTFIREQLEAFEEQLRWSIELDLSVAIHSRESFPEVFDSLRRVGADRLRGVFHSFGGSEEELSEALTFKNFYLGINGVISYKKANFRDYLHQAPLERILLETDAPYLTPVPFRGKRNEPAYLPYIVRQLASVYQQPEEHIISQTTKNAELLFAI